MGISSISGTRTVPVAEDLTTAEGRLEVLRGLENMFRVDKKVAQGVDFEMGEWAVLNSDDRLERPTSTPVRNTYLVFAGTDRFDAHATGAVTVIMNSNIVARTTQFDAAQTYAPGDGLTVKADAVLTKAGATDPVLARVQKVGDGYLVFESATN